MLEDYIDFSSSYFPKGLNGFYNFGWTVCTGCKLHARYCVLGLVALRRCPRYGITSKKGLCHVQRGLIVDGDGSSEGNGIVPFSNSIEVC